MIVQVHAQGPGHIERGSFRRLFCLQLRQFCRSVIRRPRPLFDAQTARKTMGLQVDGVDHHSLLFAVFGSQTCHHLGENTFVAPSPPTVIEGLVWAIRRRGVAPSQPITINEDNPTQHAPVIDAGLLWDFGKNGSRRAICASVSQNRSDIFTTARFSSGEARYNTKINGS